MTDTLFLSSRQDPRGTETLTSSAAAAAPISREQFWGSFQGRKFFVSTVLTPLTRFSLDFLNSILRCIPDLLC